ncbi:MAG: hypothetical protein IPK50_21240 [Fibrobacterota bacterium]|nr:hypothetical protein [Fibrobacterota bacterium]QQS04776.1 MAG: hypothetical protein IPK50_21240 [Fibrobacterota bacterium]
MAVPLEHSILPAEGERRLTLVFLHGMGGRLRDWSFLQLAFDLPWLEVVTLQGPIPHGNGWAWFELDDKLARTARTAFDIADSRRRTMETLRWLDRPFENLVLGGFSQGSVVALETGLREDVPLAGILGISGCIPNLEDYPESFGPLATRRRILSTHGQWDKTIPIGEARDQTTALAGKGVPMELEIFDKGHTLDLEDEVPRIRRWLEGCLPT